MESLNSLIRQLNRSHTPTEVPLIPDAGVQRQAIVGGILQAAQVRFRHLGNGGHLIGPGPLLGGQGDFVPGLQGMDFAENSCWSPGCGPRRKHFRPKCWCR